MRLLNYVWSVLITDSISIAVAIACNLVRLMMLTKHKHDIILISKNADLNIHITENYSIAYKTSNNINQQIKGLVVHKRDNELLIQFDAFIFKIVANLYILIA